MKRRITITITIAALALGGLASLGGTAAAADMSKVRVAHFSPDAPAVDVYVDGAQALSNVPFGAVSDYLMIPSGSHRFMVRPAGADPASTPVIDATATLAPMTAYTVAATGTLATISATIFVDDLGKPRPGRAKVRAIHAIPDVGAVDLAVTGGPVVASGLSFGEATGYLMVRPGVHRLEVRAAGTDTPLLMIKVRPMPGGIYSIAAIGEAGEGTATLMPYRDAAPAKPHRFAS